ncbi:hypothetical protein FFWV33_16285 [Flavobacterium faecale]|uniref:DUF421 domain-containing protein n=1 Tax=Flavobacterium faecale TaxID=1355330 RepID=A0A2S1LGU7_9FLAO|nr:YetF domain-containing protein [Flavobacterium faecale]AWG22973.1 hypothetical protein FFWV33_16285 [Flavobacterium faecale]
MENIFFAGWEPLLRIFVVTVIAYPSIIVLLRVSGKRTLSKMNAFDFIVTIALGSIFASVILTKSISISEGVLAFSLLIFLQYGITFLSSRSQAVSDLVKSALILMVYRGSLIKANMLKERIDEDEIWGVIRKSGYATLQDIDAVILETDGSLSVIKNIKDPKAPPIEKLL